MAKKSKFDWPTIRREYSTAQFSDSELARRHECSRGAIQLRVKKEGWQRDNSEEVRNVANAKLIALDAGLSKKKAGKKAECYKKEQSEIELAAETRVAVLRDHRKDIKRMRELEATFLTELLDNPTKEYMCNFKGDIYSQDTNIPVTEKSQALNSLANVQHKRITLERIAFNLNDGADKDDSLPMVVLHDPGQEENNE